MDIEAVKSLMQAFKETGLTKFSLKCDDFELKLGKEVNVITQPAAVDFSQAIMPLNRVSNEESSAGIEVNRSEAPKESFKAIKAPIVGTFYRADSPNAKPFVEVGSYVHKGDIVCVIEAMKLMNEVEAEEEGEVVEILVGNEDMVEYNQPLILLK